MMLQGSCGPLQLLYYQPPHFSPWILEIRYHLPEFILRDQF